MMDFHKNPLFLPFTLVLSIGLSSATSAATLELSSARAERSVNWDEGFWQTRVHLQDSKHEWVFCKSRVVETSRNPNNEPPDRGTSGYRLVLSSNHVLEWQVWVKPFGHIFDRQRRWIDVTFEVYWIDPNASQEEYNGADCEPFPPSQSPYDPGPPPPKPLPEPRQWEKTIFLRKFCVSGGYVDAYGFSNSSCGEARQIARDASNARDLCRSPNGHNEWPNDSYNGNEMWVSTPTCSPTSQ
jgi:hypothetical protein